MKKVKIKYLLIVSLLNIIFVSNIQALQINVESRPGHSTKFGYKTQTQTISGTENCNQGNSEIYCVDKGKSSVKSFSTCTITSLNGTPFETIAFDENANHDEKEFAFRMLAKKYYPGLIKSSYTYNEKYIENLPFALKNVVNNSSAGTIASSISTAKGSVTYKIQSKDSTSATVEMTIKLENKNLTQDKFIGKNGTRINDFKNMGNGTYIVTATAPMKKCKGADIDISIKGGVTEMASSTYINDTTGVFHANCTNGQNYIIIVRGQCTIDEITRDSQEGISYKVNVPDSECNCDLEGYDVDFNCKGDENNKTYKLNETSKVKQCITSGSGALEKCDSSILKLENKYCKVYCKEDIELNFPGKVTAKSGTYFTLNQPFTKLEDPIKVEGTRTCYAGQPNNPSSESVDGIDRDKYVAEVKKLQEQAITHYNRYLEIKAYMSAIESAQNADAVETNCDQTCTVYRTCSDAEQAAGQTLCGSSNNTKDPATGYYEYRSGTAEYTPKKINFNEYGAIEAVVEDTPKEVKVEWGKKAGAGSCNGAKPSCANPTDYGNVTDLTKKYNDEKATSALKSAVASINKLEEAVEEYNECFDWTNNYCGFDPKLYFSYDEVYNDEIEGYLQQKDLETNVEGNDCYYVETDESYEGVCSSTKSSNEQTYITITIDGTNGSVSTMKKSIDVSHQYVKKSQKSYKTFESNTGQKVCTYHPDGTVLIGNDCDSKDNHVTLGDDGFVFPVALEHRNSVTLYNYDLKVENIGAEGDDSNCGIKSRIIGDSCSEYSVVTRGKEGKYICQYSIGNCPGCTPVCVCPKDDPNCQVKGLECFWSENPPCETPETPTPCTSCIIECIGCLWNDGDTTIAYKTVSLNDLFPNDDTTKVGYNWNTDSEVYQAQDVDNSKKAQDTISNIEKDGSGETIYDNDDNELQYSYTLTPDTMSRIREYNKSANGENTSNIPKGGYSNDTLKCTIKNGAKYASECKSSFLDQKFMQDAEKARNNKWTTYPNGTAWK